MTSTTTAPTTSTSAAPAPGETHAAQSQLGPPYWGWQSVEGRVPAGFWGAHDHVPGDGTLVNQLGREQPGHFGVMTTAYAQPGVDFGARSLVVARFEPVSLTANGYRIDHFAFLQIGGAYTQIRLHSHRPVIQALQVSNTRNLTVGVYQRHQRDTRYGEIICRVAELVKLPLFGAGADGPQALSAATDNEALQAALEGATTEPIPFEPWARTGNHN